MTRNLNLNGRNTGSKKDPGNASTETIGRGRSIRYLLPVLYVLGDVAGVYAGFVLAYKLRFDSALVALFPITRGIPPLSLYLNALIFVCLVWIVIFSLLGQYRKRSPSSFDRLYHVLKGVTTGILLIMATTFFYRGESFSRLMLGFAWPMSIIIIWIIREVIYDAEKALFKKGDISQKAVFVGGCQRGQDLFSKLISQPAWGITPVGYVNDSDQPLPHLGRIDQLEDIIKSRGIDIVIFNLPQEKQDFITHFVMTSENLKLEYMLSPDIMGLMTFNAEAGQIEGIPILRWGRTPIEGYARVVKRSFDLILSGLGLILTAPILLITCLAVKLDSRGPALFCQRRVGRNGREFTMYKFRSMRVDENDPGAGWTIKDDPRRTRVGRFIRRYNIDELPQLFNVFMGQMSLVGPRPEQPDYVEKFRDDIPRYFHRHRVKSGVTGWAQVNGFRGDTSITERTKYDLYYVENWSLIFDVKIILQTIKNIFRSPNAY